MCMVYRGLRSKKPTLCRERGRGIPEEAFFEQILEGQVEVFHVEMGSVERWGRDHCICMWVWS